MSANWLQEKSWAHVAKYLESDNRILLPVGSTEQHGIFSPLGTDTYVALTLAEEASDRTGVLEAQSTTNKKASANAATAGRHPSVAANATPKTSRPTENHFASPSLTSRWANGFKGRAPAYSARRNHSSLASTPPTTSPELRTISR